uniref:Retrotransposon gag domain-containing protein n=1 Tax=Rhodosorus marinus TaxID=101924 RepID=A0A7S0BR66_9RHOD|mmetsp:Transcript_5686/g.8011  ORF Transcript_5686/g.8011 Transcript_5686/m.8011 type:complete len:153 (+) Transcript_5686:323-781(+)
MEPNNPPGTGMSASARLLEQRHRATERLEIAMQEQQQRMTEWLERALQEQQRQQQQRQTYPTSPLLPKKSESPMFDGTRDVEVFIHQLEHLRVVYDIEEDEDILFIALRGLAGTAIIFCRTLSLTQRSTWAELRNALRARFASRNQDVNLAV